MPGKLPLIITIDVEALPRRQKTAHVDRLIWGRFHGEEWGIGKMMDIAEKHSVSLSFFLDYCEVPVYAGAFEEISNQVAARGHDLQLHAHPELLPTNFWTERGLRENRASLTNISGEHASCLMRYLVECAQDFAARKPVAFRGGNFRFNQQVLEAMLACGLTLSFNYNVKSAHQWHDDALLPMFRWTNGVIELPLSTVPLRDFPRSFELSSFSSLDFTDLSLVKDFIDRYRHQFHDSGVLVLLLHSWSFLYRNETTGFFEYRDSRLADAFSSFLLNLPSEVECMTASQLQERLGSNDLTCKLVRDVAVLSEQTQSAGEALVGTSSPPHVERACNFCSTPAREMTDFGGRAKVRCPKCHSLERQRVFLWVYETFIRYEFDFAGKQLLLVTPSDAVLAYLRPVAQLTTCDIRPVSWFDRQIDICNMPEVPTGTYDAVIAKAVLQHVYDDQAALNEIKRVLKPLGRAFLQTSCRFNAETQPVADVTKHYGREALEKYRLGTYRYYGDHSLLRMLQERFLVKTFYGRDPVTGVIDVIYCGIKAPPCD